MATKRTKTASPKTAAYTHESTKTLVRPDAGTQAQFKKRKAPKKYRYDDSLAPQLQWDDQAGRAAGEVLLRQILEAKSLPEAQAAAAALKRLGQPFLDWAGKAERLSFDVPTLPLFVHERLSTRAIIDGLKSHRKQRKQGEFDLWGTPQQTVTDQVLRAYEHQDGWVNRLILGDSLVVMNSLLEYEGLGKKVQMIYMDPPYGVKFGSNFQPFVRKRDVSHNDDEDFTREPEMVQAYRDTWEFGVHSYLTYLRDRLLVARELLTPSGSVFVQISDENLHRVRAVMDEVFGAENFVSLIAFKKTGGLDSGKLPTVCDYLLWYARSREDLKYHQLYVDKSALGSSLSSFKYYFDEKGDVATCRLDDGGNPVAPPGARLFQSIALTSQGASASTEQAFEFKGRAFRVAANKHWRLTVPAIHRLAELGRIIVVGDNVRAVSYLDDFPFGFLNNTWTDTGSGSFLAQQSYVVQTVAKVVQRCILMTTDPGDLVLDPTCGSGTTATVAEHWGRRWLTCDVSRVPLALTRQRLLTATYPWFHLTEQREGPRQGFRYARRQNRHGDEVG
ncbi:MAG: site-specific DNA-methyltransferase, partial [Myxococcota bacterium]